MPRCIVPTNTLNASLFFCYFSSSFMSSVILHFFSCFIKKNPQRLPFPMVQRTIFLHMVSDPCISYGPEASRHLCICQDHHCNTHSSCESLLHNLMCTVGLKDLYFDRQQSYYNLTFLSVCLVVCLFGISSDRGSITDRPTFKPNFIDLGP